MTRSLWHAELPPRPTAAELPARADVVVVGGGLSGAWLALALAEAGRPPVVLEREHLAAGASGRNGGLLLPGTAELYPALVARHGPAAARILWSWALEGAHDVVATIERYGIACAWRPEGALHAADRPSEAAALEAAAALLARDGFPGDWLPPAALDAWLDVPRPPQLCGALHLPAGGAFHSGQLVAGLAAAAASRGATFVEGVAVRGIAGVADEAAAGAASGRRGGPMPVERDAGPLIVATDRGPVAAEAVVVATNAWLSELLPGLGAAVVPVRGQVLATEPLPARVVRGAWSLNDGYEYLQQLPDGRFVVGGLRWRAPDREVGRLAPGLEPSLQAGLDAWLAERFPSQPVRVAHRWAGPMSWTADRLPLVGPVPGRAHPGDDPSGDRLWVAAGYSGHGVPVAPAAARLVAAALTGRDLPEAARFVDPSRPLEPPTGVAAP